MNEKDRIKEILSGYFEERKEIKSAYLYGSVVSGKDRKESDVDIALLTSFFVDRMESFTARIRFQKEISKLIGRDVDIVFLQEAGELLSFQILKIGEVIFERDWKAHRSFRASRLIKCLDFQFYQERMQRGMVTAMRRESLGR